ncbi:endolytic transglycosylase MltG [Hydrogenovibrio thermophilus]|jgi:UPF0755 protein|uniref:Endolytic murein transglycosylase n=1 Tax=Hydrogenovibrio thermophilus TaxID=265883 RepID=A0A410H1X1_9GAMM|nr:endolytic transglycosylase MltG [Hydrogenovibrio thermophilus]QAB14901.1 endolytic transglycosylase MltG [Hydrogenovibrio thermophilus]
MQKIKLFLMTVAACVLVTWLSVEGWAFKQFLTQPISSQTDAQVVSIPKGATSRKVAHLLYEAKMVRHPEWLVWVLKWRGQAEQVKAGEIEIHPNWTLDELIDALIQGKTVTYPVTFIAGETIQQGLETLRNSPKLEKVLDYQDTAAIQAQLGLKQPLEGQFLPETYFYSADETDLSILQRSHASLQKTLQQAWANRADNLPIKTPYEALILASIVEKETGYAPERPMIAGVFVNRLRKGMRLQSDPTVIYGIGDKYDGNIRKKDLQTKTAYNTYRINGLPPTPIALASADAIHAVLNPATTKALYFVSKGNGQHVFSNTLKEHNRAVRKYILSRQ